MIRPTTAFLLCFLLGASAHAQTWTASSAAPTGYSLTPGGGDGASVYTRRFRRLGANHRLRLGVAEVDEALTPEQWIASRVREGERVVEGSGDDVALAGREGRRLTFSGTQRLRGKTLAELRTVIAARIDREAMLALESTLAFPGDEPPPPVKKAARNAVLELIAKLRVERARAEPVAAAETVTPGAKRGEYRNDSVAPFSFAYPAGWYVAHDDVQLPGALWVVATPEERTAVSSTLADVDTALRVTLVGHAPGMLGAADELARAVAFATSARSATNGTKFTVVGDTLLGAAKGRLLRYGTAEVPQLGLLLVGAADTTVLVAEFEARGGLTGDLEKTAIDILDSMRLDVDRARTERPAVAPSPGFEYPASWKLETVPVEDSSAALVLGAGETDGVEVVVRSVAVGAPLDEARLRAVLARVVADDLGLTTRERLTAAPRRAAPMGDVVVHALVATSESATDVFAIAAGDTVHVCFVDTPGGVAGRDYGLALQSLLSWSCGATAAEAPDDGRFSRRRILRHHGFDAFDDAGAARRPSGGRLAFEPDGTVRGTLPAPDASTAVSGTYTLDGGALRVDADGAAIITLRPADGGWIDAASGRAWFAAPDLD